MAALDYVKFLEPDHLADAGFAISEVRRIYDGGDGIEYRCGTGASVGRQEAVRFEEDFFLITADSRPAPDSKQLQVISEGDWIHLQFRIRGGGHETIGGLGSISTAPQTCIVTRYPNGSLIERRLEESSHFTAACLYLRPRKIEALVRSPQDALPPEWNWVYENEAKGAHTASFAISAQELAAVSDMLACTYRRSVRRNFMYARSLELISRAIGRVSSENEADRVALSAADVRRIRACRDLLVQQIDEPLTLEQLARRVGVNRSKLAYGFKATYGTSVQAYWRELRLNLARDMLLNGEASVTEVAAAVGYANISCLTRAFYHRFNYLPKQAKSRFI